MPLETTITNKIIKYINGLEGGIAEKVMGNAFQFGRPDINACYKGLCIRIEVKTPDHGNKPSKAQELDIKKWKKAGAIAFVAYSLEEVKEVFEELVFQHVSILREKNGTATKIKFNGQEYSLVHPDTRKG